MVAYVLLGILLVFIAIILTRAALYKPYDEPDMLVDEISVDREKIINNMVQMIRCRTVSYHNSEMTDWAEFERFQQLLKEKYPLVHRAFSLTKIGNTGLLYYLKGESSDNPSVCMAHYDVVPVDEDGWDKPPFEGLIEDECIWGRGTLDTKGTVCGIFEAAEQLLQGGFLPKNDLYLSFSGDEEIDGPSCPEIVDYFEM